MVSPLFYFRQFDSACQNVNVYIIWCKIHLESYPSKITGNFVWLCLHSNVYCGIVYGKGYEWNGRRNISGSKTFCWLWDASSPPCDKRSVPSEGGPQNPAAQPWAGETRKPAMTFLKSRFTKYKTNVFISVWTSWIFFQLIVNLKGEWLSPQVTLKYRKVIELLILPTNSF